MSIFFTWYCKNLWLDIEEMQNNISDLGSQYCDYFMIEKLIRREGDIQKYYSDS